MTSKISLIIIFVGLSILAVGLYFNLKKSKPVDAVLIVGAIIAFLTFVSFFAKYLQDKGSSEKSDKTLANSTATLEEVGVVQKQNIILQNQLIEQNNTIQALGIENAELHAKLNKATQETFNFMSGTGRYPYVEILTLPSTQGDEIVFRIQNKFDFPLNNVNVQIFNYDVLETLIKASPKNKFSLKLEDYSKIRVLEFRENEIRNNQYIDLVDKFPFRTGRLLIFLKSRDMVMVQKMVAVERNKQICGGYVILDKNGTEVIRSINQQMDKEVYEEIEQKLNTIPNTINFPVTN